MDSKNIKKFTYNDLKIEIHPEVYDPAEDTFIILENIELNKSDCVLEIGTGCGIIALECAKRVCNVIATDISPFAINCAKRNYIKNKNLLNANIEFRQGDLFSVIENKEEFDVIIFNPPYLPTNSNKKIKSWLNFAFDGGKDGIATTKRFLNEVIRYLNKIGKAYFIFSSYSNQEKLRNILDKNKIKAEVISSLKFDTERIDLYKIHL